TPRTLRALLEELPADLLQQPNAEGGSLTDIVAHLVDVERVAFVERITRMLVEEQPCVTSIDPPARLAAGRCPHRPLEDLLDTLERDRDRDADWLTSLSPAQLGRGGRHQDVGEIFVVGIAHRRHARLPSAASTRTRAAGQPLIESCGVGPCSSVVEHT